MTINGGTEPNATMPTKDTNDVIAKPALATSVFHRSLDLTLPVAARGEGNYLYLADGTRILDASGGAAVVSIGHGVPEVVQAVAQQIGTLPYVSSAIFGLQPAEELANMMCEDSGMGRALFLSGGSEAVESAIKLCRQYHVENGQPERTKFIAREISYHGNTLGALSLGRHNRRRKMYMPMMQADTIFHAVSPCNAYRLKQRGESDGAYVARLAAELEAKIIQLGAGTVAAFFAEPVVGAASGCVPFVPGYLRAMKAVCRKYGVLFCLDEIMCGFGRTGKLHAWQWDDTDSESAQPDVQTLGKGLCGGYAPLSAVLVSKGVVDVLARGSGAFVNGFTFQSSGTGTAAGLAVYKYIREHGLVEQCRKRGELLASLLRKKVLPHKHVGDVRGMGLFWGIELVQDKVSKKPFPFAEHVSDKITERLLELGVAVYHGTGCADGWEGDHVMLCPPYTITEAEIVVIVDQLRAAIDDVLGK